MEELLTQAGLNQLQAQTYLYLLDCGEAAPPALARDTGITRTNAYKVLDSLEELGLVQKIEVQKKFAYRAAEPSALASLVANERNRVLALEQNVKEVMQQLRQKYRKSTGSSSVTSERGTVPMVSAYEEQAEQKSPIYFIKSRADVPFLGFETMDHIRRLPGKEYGTERFGITPDGPEGPIDPAIDKRGNLTRTWVPQEAYTAPVEFSTSKDELLVTVFEDEGRTIRIKDATVAHAFQELWHLLNKNVLANPQYGDFHRRAKRQQ